jgi:hypothetical protein
MLKSAFEAGIRPTWVVAVGLCPAVGVEVYGNDGKFWWWLEQHYQQPYLLTVASSHSGDRPPPLKYNCNRDHRAEELVVCQG